MGMPEIYSKIKITMLWHFVYLLIKNIYSLYKDMMLQYISVNCKI